MSNTKTTSEQRSEKTLAGTWQLDARRSSVQFEKPHFWGFVTVKGHFAEYEGRLDLSAQPAIELTIDAATTAAHPELGMTYRPLKMIPRRSELRVEGYLVPAA